MKDFIAKLLFILLDIIMIVVSIYLANLLREHSLPYIFDNIHSIPLQTYLHFYPTYIVPIVLFAYGGVYFHRYDFWHESHIVLKAIFFSALIVFAYLGMAKIVENYSRFVIGFSFVFMAFFVPLGKNILKKVLYRFGLWRKKAAVYGDDPFLNEEIYKNPYLGYERPQAGEEPATIFINSKGSNPEKLKKLLANQLKQKHEVIFSPFMDDYDLTHSQIYELFNTRTNLIVYRNRLKSWYRKLFQQTYNYFFVLLLLPITLPIIVLIALAIKLESKGPIFFSHYRVGQNGKKFPIIKFRSMYKDARERLEKLLAENPEAKVEWEQCYKLKNDPRVTRVGNFLRKTSLDELPQIFNVLKGEMNFVGPRPVLQEEIENYYKEDAEYYYMVKPGITGLWQVSGRSDTDYDYRVDTDKWYVLNWSLWLDIVILVKTIKVVLKRDGAY